MTRSLRDELDVLREKVCSKISISKENMNAPKVSDYVIFVCLT